MIHVLSDVQTRHIGVGTRIWQYCVVLPGARIGSSCNICAHVLVENDVIVGDNVTVKSGVQLWDGLRLESDVFIGPNVTFTNDAFPRSGHRPARFSITTVGRGASIGANATILPGLTIGSRAMVGAGAVVTRSVPPNAIVIGNPATIVGYADAVGARRSGARGAPDGAAVEPTGVRGVSLHHLTTVRDIRGSLAVQEFGDGFPFKPLRYFTVCAVPSRETRGEHAHLRCHQFLVCAHGSLSVVVDDGANRAEHLLDDPSRGLYMPPMTWGIQYKFSPDAVLLVFASDAYDASDYIRDYAEFLELAGGVEEAR